MSGTSIIAQIFRSLSYILAVTGFEMISRVRERERVSKNWQTSRWIHSVHHKNAKTNQNFTFLKFLWVLLEGNISVLLDTSGLLAASYFAF